MLIRCRICYWNLEKIVKSDMKNLKNYIKNYIDESVWDIEDNIEDDNKEFILQEIKKFHLLQWIMKRLLMK